MSDTYSVAYSPEAFAAFYIVDDDRYEVNVIRVFYGGRDVKNIISTRAK